MTAFNGGLRSLFLSRTATCRMKPSTWFPPRLRVHLSTAIAFSYVSLLSLLFFLDIVAIVVVIVVVVVVTVEVAVAQAGWLAGWLGMMDTACFSFVSAGGRSRQELSPLSRRVSEAFRWSWKHEPLEIVRRWSQHPVLPRFFSLPAACLSLPRVLCHLVSSFHRHLAPSPFAILPLSFLSSFSLARLLSRARNRLVSSLRGRYVCALA